MLGRCSEAIQEGKRACELLPITKDSWTGPTLVILSGIDLCRVRRERSRVGPTGNLSQSSGRNHLRPTKKRSRLGSLTRRSAVRQNRHVARAERCDFDQVKSDNSFAELKRRNVYKVAVAVRHCRLAASADRNAGFPISRDSKLGCAAGDCVGRDRFANRARHCVGIRTDPGRIEAHGHVDALLATNVGVAAHRNDPGFEQLLTVNEYVGH